jgi:hypothetical protein
MSAEELNNIPESNNQSEAPASASSTSAASAAPQIDTAAIIAQAKQAALSEVQNIPGFKQYQEYENFKNSQAKPQSPFDTELNLANITDATQHLHNQMTAEQQRLTAIEQKAQYLEAKEAQRDYEVALNQLNSYWETKYTDEATYNKAVSEAIPYLPKELQTQWVNANSGTGTLDAVFLAHLNQAMSNMWLAKLDDPNSGALDALLAEKAQRKALQNKSMLSSQSQTSGSGKQVDDYSAKVTYYD